MANPIGWTDETWNPTTGCHKVSPGCKNCYAEKMHARLTAMGQAKYSEPFSVVRTHDNALELPLRWKKPRSIFVNSMSDLFHPDVPDDFIDRVFAVMTLCPHHQFQILTKRAERLPEWFFGSGGRRHVRVMDAMEDFGANAAGIRWPLPNVWLGVSAENQEQAYRRIPHLIQTSAAVRFVSAEPLLGTLDLTPWLRDLDWMIAGCESGPKRRPTQVDWLVDLRDQCARAGVPYYLKQMDQSGRVVKTPYLDGEQHLQFPEVSR